MTRLAMLCGKFDLLIAVVGVGFAFAGASKLMDPFFWGRLTADAAFTISAVLDISVGCLLVPRERIGVA